MKCLKSNRCKENYQTAFLFCSNIRMGDTEYCLMVAFDLHNCTTGGVCAALSLENIDLVLYLLSTKRINWFACFSAPLLVNKGHSVFSLRFRLVNAAASVERHPAEHSSTTGILVNFCVLFILYVLIFIRDSAATV